MTAGKGGREHLSTPGDPTPQRWPLPSSHKRSSGLSEATMTLLTVALALTIFTGSQSFVLRDESDSRLVQLNQELKEFPMNITRVVDEKVDLVRRSELGQQLLDQVRESYSRVSKRLNNLETQLPASVKQAFDLVVGVSWDTGEKALSTLFDLRRKVSAVPQELSEALYSILAPYANSILEKVGPYTEALRSALITTAEELNPELNEKLKQQLEELRVQLSPYIQKLQSQLQELQASLEPIAGQAQEKLRGGVEAASQALQPYIGPILKTLQEYAEVFKKWMDIPVTPQDERLLSRATEDVTLANLQTQIREK